MLAHNSLVVLESASLTALTLMAAVLVTSVATTATTTSTATSTSSLEDIAFSTSTVHAASHCVSTASSHSTTATSATLVLIEPLSTARHATLAKVLSITTTWCAIMTTASAIATTILVTITAATATIATAPAVVIVSTTLVTVLHVALRAASIPSRRLLLRVATSHATALAATTRVVLSLSDDLSASLHSHVLWDRVIDVAKLSVSMGILAILIPLTVAFVFKVATLLSLESLIDLALFERLATWDLLLAGHAWHWLLAGHLLLVLLGHGHLLWLLLRVANQLLAIGIAVDRHGHERLLGDSGRLRRRRLELLLGSGLLCCVLLLRL